MLLSLCYMCVEIAIFPFFLWTQRGWVSVELWKIWYSIQTAFCGADSFLSIGLLWWKPICKFEFKSSLEPLILFAPHGPKLYCFRDRVHLGFCWLQCIFFFSANLVRLSDSFVAAPKFRWYCMESKGLSGDLFSSLFS